MDERLTVPRTQGTESIGAPWGFVAFGREQVQASGA